MYFGQSHLMLQNRKTEKEADDTFLLLPPQHEKNSSSAFGLHGKLQPLTLAFSSNAKTGAVLYIYLDVSTAPEHTQTHTNTLAD